MHDDIEGKMMGKAAPGRTSAELLRYNGSEIMHS